MKKLISFGLLLTFVSASWAQVDKDKGTLGIDGYTSNAALIIQSKKLLVKNGSTTDSFSIKKNGENYELEQAADSSKIFSIIQLNPQSANNALADIAGTNTINKLLDITSKMNGQKLLIQASGNEGVNSDLPEEGAVPAIEVKETSKPNWLMMSLFGIGGLILGFVLSKLLQKKPEPQPELIDVSQPDLSENIVKVEKPSAADKKLIEELKQELASIKERNALITDKTQKLIDGDNVYYQAVFDQIILPLQTALDNGNEMDIVKFVNLAMVHFSSITRVKIRKKQNYDDANIQLITGNSSLSQEFKTIDSNTPIDKIPANLRVLIDILRKSGVQGLGDTVIKGYKLKNL